MDLAYKSYVRHRFTRENDKMEKFAISSWRNKQNAVPITTSRTKWMLRTNTTKTKAVDCEEKKRKKSKKKRRPDHKP